MKKINLLSLILTVFFVGFSFSAIAAQDEFPEPDAPPQQLNQKRHPKLLDQLNLSSAQIQEIRRLNSEKKPLLRQAQDRLRQANRNLDEAVYADNVNEADIQARLKELHQAQSELAKIRLMNELAVRKVLTNEQITKFRQLREQFNQKTNNRQNERRNRRMNSDKRPPGIPGGRFLRDRNRFPPPGE